jgi:PAS domain S-box-containing protein
MKKINLKISTKIILLFFMIILLHMIVSLISLSLIISETNNASQENQMLKTIDGVSSYLEKTVIDLDLKVRLLAGQNKVIEYTELGLHSLLNRELVIYWQSLNIDYISIYKGDISNLPNITLNTDKISVTKDDISRLTSIGEEIPQNILFINNLILALEGKTSSYITDADNDVMLVVVSPIVRNKEVIAALAIGILLDKNFILSLEEFFNSQIIFTSNERIVNSDDLSPEIMDTLFGNISKVKTTEKIFTNTNYIIGHIPTSLIGLSGGYLYCIYNTDELKKQISQYNIISIIISLVTLCAAMLAGVSFYRSTFIHPFQSLISGINKISADNIYPPFEEPGNDEFGEVAETFNQMCLDLQVGKKEIERLSLYNSLILENMKSGILTINLSGEIITVNPSAYMIIKELEEARIGKVSLLSLPDTLRGLINSVLSTKRHVTGVELRINTGDIEKEIALSTSQLRSQGGSEIGVIAVLEDITKIRNLEDKLVISSRLAALGEMAAGVAHQIRNPLAVMKVSMEMLREDLAYPDNDTEAGDLTGFILNEIDTLDSVVNNFLAFAKPNRGNKSYESVEDLLDFTIRSIPLDKYDGIRLIREIDSDIGEHYFDRNLIVQAFSNIIINAFQCSEKGDRIIIRAYRNESALCIEIDDEGKGMSKEIVAKIYNPFFTTKETGTGLGLSIVHRIIEDHNGSIQVDSKQDKGTLFRLMFQETT